MTWRELAIAWAASIAGYFVLILVFDAPKWAALLGSWVLVVMCLLFSLIFYLRSIVRLVAEALHEAFKGGSSEIH